MMNPDLAFVCLVVGGVLLFAGLVFFLVGRREQGAAVASEAWPTTPGRILTSEVTGSPKMRKASITYSYTVAGEALVGASTTVAGGFGQGEAARLVAKFPVGAEVAVAYEPANPARSLLEPGAASSKKNLTVGRISLWASAALLLLTALSWARLI